MHFRFSHSIPAINKLLLILLLSAISFNLFSQTQDFSRVKSKYDFNTPATEKLSGLINAKKYDEALELANRAISISEKSLDYEELVYLLERKAYVLRRMDNFHQAELIINEAINNAKSHLVLNHILLSKLYFLRGQISHRKRDFYIASSFFDTAQVIYAKSIQYDSALYNEIIDYKYYAYSYAEKNVDTLSKYLDIRYNYAVSNPKSNAHDIVNLLNDYPGLNREKGDFDQALRYSIKEVMFANDKIDEIEANDLVRAYRNLVYTLYFTKQYSLALQISDQIISMDNTLDKESDKTDVNSIRSLQPLIYTALGNHQEAIKSSLKSIQTFSESTKYDEIKFLIQLEINLAKSYLRINDQPKALVFLNKAIKKIRLTSEFPDKQAESFYSTLGEYYQSKNEFTKAFIYFDSAIRNGIPEYFFNPSLEFPLIEEQKISFYTLLGLKSKATALIDLFENEKLDSIDLLISAEEYVLGTHQILLSRRKELIRSEGKLFLSSNFRNLYESGMRAAYLLNKNGFKVEGIKSAIEVLRMSKSALFLEQAGLFDEINIYSVPQTLKEEYYTLEKNSKKLSSEFDKHFNSKSFLNENIKLLNNNILENNNKISLIQDSITRFILSENDYLKSKSTELNQKLIPKSQAIIEFFVGENSIYILARTNQNSVFKQISLTEELKAIINDLIETVSHPPNFSAYTTSLDSFQSKSNLVYETLLSPLLNELKGDINKITFIPDDFLSRLPFEILTTSKSDKYSSFQMLPYLINSYSINYQLSSDLQVRPKREIAPNNILGIGYSNNSSIIGKKSLPGSEEEISLLDVNFEGEFYLGKSGTKQLFLDRAKDFDILHLAIHGEEGKINQFESRLIFNGNDSILNTEDLYLADLNARLVVLSACQSGAGELIKGEGVISIARSFALVGVPSIVMSLWSVNDRKASDLMLGFHEELAKGINTNESLRKSKLEYLRKSDNYTSHPYYWASFVSLGDPIKIKAFHNYNKQIIVILLISSILIFSIFAVKKRRKVN